MPDSITYWTAMKNSTALIGTWDFYTTHFYLHAFCSWSYIPAGWYDGCAKQTSWGQAGESPVRWNMQPALGYEYLNALLKKKKKKTQRHHVLQNNSVPKSIQSVSQDRNQCNWWKQQGWKFISLIPALQLSVCNDWRLWWLQMST